MGQLHIRLSDEDKEEWEEYVEENGYESLSRFVRLAVANERNDERRHPRGGTEQPTVSIPENVATANDVNQVNDSLLKIVDRLEEVEQRVAQAEKAMVEPNDTRAVLEALPSERPTADTEGYEKSGSPDLEQPKAGVAMDGTPESVAAVAEETATSVKSFLAQSAHRSDSIKAEKIGGKLRYWVEEDD